MKAINMSHIYNGNFSSNHIKKTGKINIKNIKINILLCPTYLKYVINIKHIDEILLFLKKYIFFTIWCVFYT